MTFRSRCCGRYLTFEEAPTHRCDEPGVDLSIPPADQQCTEDFNAPAVVNDYAAVRRTKELCVQLYQGLPEGTALRNDLKTTVGVLVLLVDTARNEYLKHRRGVRD